VKRRGAWATWAIGLGAVLVAASVGCHVESDATGDGTIRAGADGADGADGAGGGLEAATTTGAGSGGSVSTAADGAGGGAAAIDCKSAPLVTWASFGDAFAMRYCTGCHASTTLDRHGAPEGVDFDDKDTFLAYAYLILDAVDRDDPDAGSSDVEAMPPGGGVAHEERLLLRTWLTCNIEADRGF